MAQYRASRAGCREMSEKIHAYKRDIQRMIAALERAEDDLSRGIAEHASGPLSDLIIACEAASAALYR